MKILHSSDLHIGKKLNGFSMIEEQIFVLNEILRIAKTQEVDAVILAGDIYDKSIPSTDAIEIFDEFLVEFSKTGIALFIISGNHDSPERLGFGNRLFYDKNIFIVNTIEKSLEPFSLFDDFGEVRFYLLPFLKPIHIKNLFLEDCKSFDDALKFMVDKMAVDSSVRNVLVTHQFVTGAVRTESEEVNVGGLDNVKAENFDIFDYVALGHIHCEQEIHSEFIRYSGSPLKYSFSEVSDKKGVTIVEMFEKGNSKINTVEITPVKELQIIKGKYNEITAKDFWTKINRDNYFKIVLTDEEDIPDVVNKLRVFYENVMKIEYDNLRTKSYCSVEDSQDTLNKSPIEIFSELFAIQNNRDMNEKEMSLITDIIKEAFFE